MIRAWTFVAAFFVLFIFATGGDPRIRYFPWGEKSFQEHQDDILDGFREDMFLDFKEDTLPKEFLSFEMHVKNLEGLIFSMEKDRKGLTKVKSSWSPIIDVHVINALLDGVCGMFHVQYWVYEWCHMNEIRQFHMEIVNGAVGRNPDWSLGSFQRSIVVRERGDFANFSAAIVKVCFNWLSESHEIYNSTLCHRMFRLLIIMTVDNRVMKIARKGKRKCISSAAKAHRGLLIL